MEIYATFLGTFLKTFAISFGVIASLLMGVVALLVISLFYQKIRK